MAGRSRYALGTLTSPGLSELATSGKLVILVPVGSVEPHGPHLGLVTDTVISEAAAERGAARLDEAGYEPRIAPAISYGVTECARSFSGAVSIPAQVLTAYLRAVTEGFLGSGAAHVCLINNHLEPAHDRAVRAAARDVEPGRASVACPLTRRWARTLSAEFKSGACHAGRYETSIVMARDRSLVDEAERGSLPSVRISLSEKLRSGVTDFEEMGLERAYAGAPAEATAEEGEELIELLAVMVEREVREALGDHEED